MKSFIERAIGGKVLLNIQTRSVEASVQAAELLGKAVFTGVMAKDFPVLEEGVRYIQALQERKVQVSAGLGDGSADQWEKALQLALHTAPLHLNQIFPAAGLSQYALRMQEAPTLVNAMVRPAGQPGIVDIGTGPLSQQTGSARVPVEAALAMMKEAGVQSVKFFPIEGSKRLEEVRAVARAAAKEGMMIEPTGGITPDNAAEIVQVCLDAGVPCIMPHLYGSLKNPETGDLDKRKLEATYRSIMSLFGE
ncbi:KDGP aldolase [Paenibacillus piri]|uniref:Oxo-acid lyase n=1 Tax=Paenibacillus piri TaxID=2547395 RepID=A0A4R5KC89_9BACL|nr:KDGP aldolase [Paenibacillus piri]TDF92736.1 oxo-acid lyase [Paenibacillus piri]